MALFVAILYAPVAAAQPADLVSGDLVPTRVTVVSMDRQTLMYIDQEGAEQTMPRDQVLRLRMVSPESAKDDDLLIGAAWLVDGQVLRGLWAGAIDEETIRWQTLNGRELALPLERLKVVSLSSPDRPKVQAGGDDVLGLINGEQLRGFAETVADGSVGFIIGESDQAVPLPLERVSWLAIANDSEPVQAEDHAAWVELVGGSRVLIDDMAIQRDIETGEAIITGKMPLDPENAQLQLAVTRVQSIEPLGGLQRLESLLQLEPSVVAGGEVFGLAIPPKRDREGRLHVHAPLTLEYNLAPGASRLSLAASLDLGPDVPVERARLAGLELVIRQGGEELFRQAIDIERREVQVNLKVAGGPLQIELDPAVNGPVLDRLMIESAEVLVEQQ